MKPKAIIFDIDGTLALRGNRDPYDMTRVGDDKVNQPVVMVARYLQFAFEVSNGLDRETWSRLIFTTGRDESCRHQTQLWLEEQAGMHPFHVLLMRADGDARPDEVVKKEMLDQIQETYDIICVFDDRDKVVKMWRDNGIACFQVAPGDF